MGWFGGGKDLGYFGGVVVDFFKAGVRSKSKSRAFFTADKGRRRAQTGSRARAWVKATSKFLDNLIMAN